MRALAPRKRTGNAGARYGTGRTQPRSSPPSLVDQQTPVPAGRPLEFPIPSPNESKTAGPSMIRMVRLRADQR